MSYERTYNMLILVGRIEDLRLTQSVPFEEQ